MSSTMCFYIFIIILSISCNEISSLPCSQGCSCYSRVIECSDRNLHKIPNFPTQFKRPITRFLLRGNPDLDLTNFNFAQEYVSLQAIDLTGKYVFKVLFLVYFK